MDGEKISKGDFSLSFPHGNFFFPFHYFQCFQCQQKLSPKFLHWTCDEMMQFSLMDIKKHSSFSHVESIDSIQHCNRSADKDAAQFTQREVRSSCSTHWRRPNDAEGFSECKIVLVSGLNHRTQMNVGSKPVCFGLEIVHLLKWKKKKSFHFKDRLIW